MSINFKFDLTGTLEEDSIFLRRCPDAERFVKGKVSLELEEEVHADTSSVLTCALSLIADSVRGTGEISVAEVDSHSFSIVAKRRGWWALIYCNDMIGSSTSTMRLSRNWDPFESSMDDRGETTGNWLAQKLKQYPIKKYGFDPKTREIKVVKFYQWLCAIAGIEPSQPVMKEIQQILKGGSKWYLYSAQKHMVSLAQMVNIASKSKSCMMKQGFDDTWRDKTSERVLEEAPCDERDEDEDAPCITTWAHPFACYEYGENKIYLVSSHSPAELKRKTWATSPFIIRGFGLDGRVARFYGATDRMNPYTAFSVVGRETPWDLRLAVYEDTDGDEIAPFVDGGDDFGSWDDNLYEDWGGSSYLNCLTYVRAETDKYGQSFSVYQIQDPNDLENGDTYYRVGYENGVIESYTYSTTARHTCAIEQEDYDEEDMRYVSDIDDWVYYRYARWGSDQDGYILDGRAILDYFR